MPQVITKEQKGSSLIKLHESLKNSRSNWDQHWDQVARFVIPRKDNVYGQAVRGEKQGNELFDTEAIAANDDLAAALHSMLTSPSFMWFGLGLPTKELREDEAAVKWAFESAQTMIRIMNQSNFQTEIHETYLDLGSIGTGVLRIEEDDETVVRYYSEPVYDVVIRENHRGVIDFVSREYEFDGRQVQLEFENSMDDETRKYVEEATRANPNKRFKIIHQVSVRTKSEMEGQLGAKGFPVGSTHVLKDNAMILRESGFNEWPYATPRWSKINTEVYGRSPAMKCLADIKMANQFKKVTIQGAQLGIAPPMQVPDNGFLTPPQIKPFGVNYYRSGSKDRMEPLFTGANPQLGEELLNLIHNSIRKHFMTDKLITPQLDRMTAAEAMQRRDESMRLLGPQVGRMDSELLKTIIDRTFSICMRAGVFEEMPESLSSYLETADVVMPIEYRSTIAQAQLMAQAENTVRAINATAFVIGPQPEVMDNIDGDKLLKSNFKTYNVDPQILRSGSDVKQIRQQRAEQAQAMAQAEQAQQSAETVATMEGAEGEPR